MRVARNSNTPAEALTTLASDSDEEIRREVANHPGTPAKALTTLATDSDYEVRSNVARKS